MGRKPFCIGLLVGLCGATLAVALSACGDGAPPTATAPPVATAIPSATRPPPTLTAVPTVAGIDLPPRAALPPTLTLVPFQLTAQAQYRQQVATQEAVRALACQYVAEIYRRHGQPFDPTKDPQLLIAEVRALEGLSDPQARLSYGGSVVDSTNSAMVLRCTAR